MRKQLKKYYATLLRALLAMIYVFFSWLFFVPLISIIKYMVIPLGYPDPVSHLYGVVYAVILAVGIYTQLRLAVAIVRRSKKVAVISRFDLLAGAVRAFMVLGYIWDLRYYLPVYFFRIDACACSDYRALSSYYPLDNYYYLLEIGLGVLLFLLVAVLPLWFFNRSRFASKLFIVHDNI